jgi:hypothetical protein
VTWYLCPISLAAYSSKKNEFPVIYENYSLSGFIWLFAYAMDVSSRLPQCRKTHTFLFSHSNNLL